MDIHEELLEEMDKRIHVLQTMNDIAKKNDYQFMNLFSESMGDGKVVYTAKYYEDREATVVVAEHVIS